MLKTTARKWYLAILFLSVFCLLVGCQQTDAGSNTGSVQITPADQIHTENLTLLERVEYSLVPDEVRASVELYTSASIADDSFHIIPSQFTQSLRKAGKFQEKLPAFV